MTIHFIQNIDFYNWPIRCIAFEVDYCINQIGLKVNHHDLASGFFTGFNGGGSFSSLWLGLAR